MMEWAFETQAIRLQECVCGKWAPFLTHFLFDSTSDDTQSMGRSEGVRDEGGWERDECVPGRPRLLDSSEGRGSFPLSLSLDVEM